MSLHSFSFVLFGVASSLGTEAIGRLVVLYLKTPCIHVDGKTFPFNIDFFSDERRRAIVRFVLGIVFCVLAMFFY